MAQEQKNYEELIEDGHRAAALLDNPDFQSVFQDLKRVWTDNILMSAPAETETRETHYHLCLALDAIQGALHSRVTQAYEIEQVLDEESKEGGAENPQGDFDL